jgi:exodeoxyribonuclease V gamma subunit
VAWQGVNPVSGFLSRDVMAGLTLFTSNRLEVLVDLLGEVISEPLASPLEKEVIIVQSKGMERWVSMELARRHGICANYRFPFPNAMLDEIFHLVLGAEMEVSPFDPDVMVWRIMRLLPDCLHRPGFEVLRGYLTGDAGRLKLYQLAERIADLFDQYLVFRPDMMLAWEDGAADEDEWQQVLWKELAGESRGAHRARLREDLIERLRRMNSMPGGLPRRLSIFGISALPPFHMAVFNALASFIPVNLFLMNPCREYWADILSDRESSRLTRLHGARDTGVEALHMEPGNNLLASMGKLGRNFFSLVQEIASEEFEDFREPGEESLLACLQSDILHLVERNAADKRLIDANDRSVAIHSCHSPMREIEVLHDQLLALFEQEPDLEPRDVLVMTPDIDAYAPYIHAVFDGPEHESLKIPYSITDRNLRRESRIIEAYLSILDLAGSRMEASRVLALIESGPLRRRFDLAESDIPLIHRWVRDTRIRWGVDEKSRAEMGFGDFAENSWRAGLDRLLLGYAIPGGGERLFESILPYDQIEGGDAVVLGKFLQFTELLFRELSSLVHARSLTDWAADLTGLLDSFFAPDEDAENEVQALRRVLNDLGSGQDTAGFTQPVAIEVIRSFLGARLEKEIAGLGFITGGVTFCAMLPMRSIPFQVIYMVGMSDGAFPRRGRTLGFDLMAKSPRVGDRSQRDDDRYLFLEALLSARRRLIISHVGQSMEDNSTLPPSVMVSELLDEIGKGFEVAEADDIVEHLTTRHRLQPFNPSYYTREDRKLFGYSSENCRAGQGLQGGRMWKQPFFPSSVGEPEEEWRLVDVDRLAAFFSHPAKFLLQRRLQVQLDLDDISTEDRESFELDHLDQYLLTRKLLERRGEEADLGAFYPVIKASGELPHGAVGRCAYGMLTGRVESFYALIEPYIRAGLLPPLAISLQLERFQLTGRIDRITGLGLVHYRSANLKARDHLNLWVRHLAMNACVDRGNPHTSFLIGKDGLVRYAPVKDAAGLLKALLETYWDGLQRPVHFFPQSSFAYACKIAAGEPREHAIKAARKEWEPNPFAGLPSESEDRYSKLCFRGMEALDLEFERLAEEVFRPLLSHIEKES